MYVFLRLTTITLGVLAFAIVFSVCGEAFACGGCSHFCCIKTDRTERRRSVVGEIVKAVSKFAPVPNPSSGVAGASVYDRFRGQSASLCLAPKVAQLRI